MYEIKEAYLFDFVLRVNRGQTPDDSWTFQLRYIGKDDKELYQVSERLTSADKILNAMLAAMHATGENNAFAVGKTLKKSIQVLLDPDGETIGFSNFSYDDQWYIFEKGIISKKEMQTLFHPKKGI